MVTAQRTAVVIGALAGALAVAGGAFSAHGLEAAGDALAAERMATAARYAMWHGLALLAAAALGLASPLLVAAFGGGILLFSGSVAALALGAPVAVATAAPLGGLAFLVGWLVLAVSGWRRYAAPPSPSRRERRGAR